MSNTDDYIKTGKADPVPEAQEGSSLDVTPEEARATVIALSRMEWSGGLTRDQLKRKYPDLPLGIYLRLPDSKHFGSAQDVLHQAGIAASRAEGDFLGANPDIPDEDSIGDGGPPAWGGQSGIYAEGTTNEGGSAEDTEGLLPGDEPGEEPASD